MTAPETWNQSLSDLLKNCEFLCKLDSNRSSYYDLSQPHNAISDYKSRATPYEVYHNMTDLYFDFGTKDGNDCAVGLYESPSIPSIKSFKAKGLLPAVVSIVKIKAKFRGLSGDSYIFNEGFIAGSTKAREMLSHGKVYSLDGHSNSYAHGFASAFAEMYPMQQVNDSARSLGTMQLPDSLNDESFFFAEGYAVGFIAGYRST